MGPNTAQLLTAGLNRWPNLTHLDVASKAITMHALPHTLASPRCVLPPSTTVNNLRPQGGKALATALKQCTQLTRLKVKGIPTTPNPNLSHACAAPHSPSCYCRRLADNNLDADTVASCLQAALEGPAYQWLDSSTGLDLTPEALSLAGIPPELAHDRIGVASYIAQQHLSKARGQESCCRGTLVIIGYQGAGKSSLVWRLRNLASTTDMPVLESTDGIAFGTLPKLNPARNTVLTLPHPHCRLVGPQQPEPTGRPAGFYQASDH